MNIIKMTKNLNANDDERTIIAKSLSSFLFSISISKYNKYENYSPDEFSLYFNDSNKRIIKISLGKTIVDICDKNDIECMIIHSNNLLSIKDEKDFVFHYWYNGVKDLSASNNIIDILDGIFLSFKTQEDYEKFMINNF